MKATLGITGWFVALLVMGACVYIALSYRSLYIKERLTSVQLIPAASATRLPSEWNGPGRRILLAGDSRIAEWRALPKVEGLVFATSGVGGETTGEFDRRFRRDVLETAPKPDAVVLAIGINDLAAASTAENWAEAIQAQTLDTMLERIADMARLARADGIDVHLATIIAPAEPDLVRKVLFWDDSLYGLVRTANGRIRVLGTAQGYPVLDLDAVLTGGEDPLPPRYARDTLHFKGEAYDALNAYLLQEFSRP